MARILIVDDVKFISRMLCDMLTQRGHETMVAEDGVEALEIALDDPPDLILLDLEMPRMDGLEVARILRGEPGTCAVPIMVITANRDAASMNAAVGVGVDEYLTKPFDDNLLFDRIDRLLETSYGTFLVGAAGDVPVVTLNVDEKAKGDRADDLRRALGAAGQRGSGSIVVDLSGADLIAPEVADVILAIQTATGATGPHLEIVGPPAHDLGTRLALARIAREASLHDNREAAVEAARSPGRPDSDESPEG